jgi:hypothetical protein
MLRRAAALVVLALPLAAQAPDTTRRMAASSFATVEVHLNSRPIEGKWYAEDASLAGPARIAISYGQPHARGRKIVGGLIPNDTVWRFGSNFATTLHTEVDLTLGTLALPRGDYTLFLLHSSAGNTWQLIVSSETAQWGTDYNGAKDVGRVAMSARTMNDNEETLTMYLVPESPRPQSGYAALRGVMRVRWGTVELSTPWSVR